MYIIFQFNYKVQSKIITLHDSTIFPKWQVCLFFPCIVPERDVLPPEGIQSPEIYLHVKCESYRLLKICFKKPSGSILGWKFYDQLPNYWFLKKDSAP